MIKNYLLSLANSVKAYYTGSAAFDRALERNNRLLRKFHGGVPPPIQESMEGIRKAHEEQTQMIENILGIKGQLTTAELLTKLTENLEITKLLINYLVELQKLVSDEKVGYMIKQLEEIKDKLNGMLI